MSVPPRRVLWLFCLVALTAAVAGLAWWLAQPERDRYFNAVSLGIGAAGFGVAALAFVWQIVKTPGASAAESPELFKDQLADAVLQEVGNEIKSLKLSGSDYIQVEWSVNSEYIVGPDVAVKRSRTRDLSTLAEDWRADRSRLTVVLGPKGAGKSSAALFLIHQLLGQRRQHDPDGPIPVLCRIGGWNPDTDLSEWIAQQLAQVYGLPRAGRSGGDIALRLVTGGHVLAVLDGFDEIPQPLRGKAFERLRAGMDVHGSPMVLTSRIEEFETAVDTSRRPATSMSVVTLQPVSPAKAKIYLQRFADADHWKDLFDQLDQDGSPVAKALTTPLMVYLCGEVYQHRDRRPDTQALTNFADQTTLEQHLVARLLPLRYANDAAPGHPDSHADQSIRHLRFIARHMNRTGRSDFAWWQLHKSFNHRTIKVATKLAGGLAFALVAGLAVGLWFGLTHGLVVELTAGLEFGLIVGLIVRLTAPRPENLPARIALDIRNSARGLVFGLKAGLMTGLTAGLLTGLMTGLLAGLTAGLTAGLLTGLLAGLLTGSMIGQMIGLMIGLTAGVSSPQTPAQLQAHGPRRILRSSRMVATISGLVAGLVAVLMTGLPLGLMIGPMAVLMAGLVLALAVTLHSAPAWSKYRLAHLILCFPGRRRLPVRLMSFLENAHRLGILRQFGATYEFRHEALHTYLTSPEQTD